MNEYKYYVGCDLGAAQDYSTVSVVERSIEWREDKGIFISTYLVKQLLRYPKRTSYPDVVDSIKTIFQHPYIESYGELIVDKTGVGRPVIEMMEREGLSPIGITITGGNTVTKDVEGHGYNVPKAHLISAFLIMAQSGQFHIAGGLPLAKALQKELEAFQVKIKRDTGHEIYEGEGEHDDLVICVALPLWYAHQFDEQTQTLDQLADNYDKDEQANKKFNYLTGELE